MNKKKLFITVHHGMVGSNLLEYFKKKYNFITVNRNNLDLNDEKELNLFLNENKPDIILHATAKATVIVSNNDEKL